MVVYGVEAPTFRKVDKRYIESTEMWCWRRMEKIGCTDCVKDYLRFVIPVVLYAKWGRGWVSQNTTVVVSHIYIYFLLVFVICKLTYDLKMAKHGRNMSS